MGTRNNAKAIGEKGQNCVIGEFAKWDITVAIVLSDNLPYEMIAIVNDKLFKVQVKTSARVTKNGAVEFDLTSNNWNKGTVTKYTAEDCDVFVCYDLTSHSAYLLAPKEFANRKSFTIRRVASKNNQGANCNMHDNFVMSEKRIGDVF